MDRGASRPTTRNHRQTAADAACGRNARSASRTRLSRGGGIFQRRPLLSRAHRQRHRLRHGPVADQPSCRQSQTRQTGQAARQHRCTAGRRLAGTDRRNPAEPSFSDGLRHNRRRQPLCRTANSRYRLPRRPAARRFPNRPPATAGTQRFARFGAGNTAPPCRTVRP